MWCAGCTNGSTVSLSQAPVSLTEADAGDATLAASGDFINGVPTYIAVAGNALLPVQVAPELAPDPTATVPLDPILALAAGADIQAAGSSLVIAADGSSLATGGLKAIVNGGQGAASTLAALPGLTAAPTTANLATGNLDLGASATLAAANPLNSSALVGPAAQLSPPQIALPVVAPIPQPTALITQQPIFGAEGLGLASPSAPTPTANALVTAAALLNQHVVCVQKLMRC